jgi:hypothetical protein
MKPRKIDIHHRVHFTIHACLPGQMAAQHRRYKLIDLDTLGGPNNFVAVAGDLPVVLNNEEIVVGCPDTSTADARFPDFSPLLSPPAPDPPPTAAEGQPVMVTTVLQNCSYSRVITAKMNVKAGTACASSAEVFSMSAYVPAYQSRTVSYTFAAPRCRELIR